MEKIVIFTGTLSFGGSERVISILSKSLLKHYNIEIILFYNRPIWYEMDERIKITLLNDLIPGKGSIFKKIMFYRKYIKKVKPKTVISFLAPFNIFSIISLIYTGIPIIVAERNDPRHIPNRYYLRWLRNFLYFFAHFIVVQTENNKKYFSKKIQQKCHVIYNPISIDKEIGKALNIKKQKKIVSVGRLIDQKNHRLLVNAFCKIHEMFPEYRLIIYGEGDERENLLNLIKRLGLENYIELPGVKKDVNSLILDAELFILPSNFEGMPNALIEAMCIGLPCISTKVSGAVDLIKNEENGILINIGSESELVEKIKLVLENKELANTLGHKACEISKVLNKEKVVGDWIDLIHRINK
nr:glycosyltransferase [Paenibacillus bovis]